MWRLCSYPLVLRRAFAASATSKGQLGFPLHEKHNSSPLSLSLRSFVLRVVLSLPCMLMFTAARLGKNPDEKGSGAPTTGNGMCADRRSDEVGFYRAGDTPACRPRCFFSVTGFIQASTVLYFKGHLTL